MIRIFYITLLLLPLEIIASSLYTVKLGIYEDQKIIEKVLFDVPPALRKTIITQDLNDSYQVKTLNIENKGLLSKLLPAYQKVFPDAHIITLPSPNVTKLEESVEKKPDDFYIALQNKMMLYLCPQAEDAKSKKFLIEVAFGKKTANYSPVLGKVPPMTALYKVEDGKLFLYQKGLLNPNVYSLLEETNPTYFLISSWVDGKKIKTLRYYFNVRDAKAYLDSY